MFVGLSQAACTGILNKIRAQTNARTHYYMYTGLTVYKDIDYHQHVQRNYYYF